LQKADELGLILYEEPGGFHTGGQGYDVAETPFSAALMLEKLRRMIIRDRNHPSLLFYNLGNEDAWFPPLRQQGLTMVSELDGTRLVSNSSGGTGGQARKGDSIDHIRPYESAVRKDFMDNHTVFSGVTFDENDFNMHEPPADTHPHYWGEVKCYSAPDTWTETARWLTTLKKQKPADYKGYNYSHYIGFGKKIEDYFNRHRLKETGSGVVLTPDAISIAAGNSKMYNEGRNAQTIMSYDTNDGYAINAWSGGNGFETWSGWYSGLVDDNRNIKGDPDIYGYYTRELQVVIRRLTAQKISDEAVGGKLFGVGGKAAFYIGLINQGILPAGDYTLKLRVKDGAGVAHPSYDRTVKVSVKGGDVFAQIIDNMFIITLDASLRGGFITLEGELFDATNKQVADGAEQVLFTNRSSFAPQFKGLKGEVYGWQAAKDAIKEAQAEVSDFSTGNGKTDFIAAAGDILPATLDAMLSKVQSGARLLLRFDSIMALRLFEKGLLAEKVTVWGAPQSDGWIGNGFGYIDYFVGASIPLYRNNVTINGWEVPNKAANAFEPFSSNYKTSVYGVYIARPDVIRTILGAINYGKGKILLQAAYPVDATHPFNDLLFYNLLTKKLL
jgi:hypothetical protein